MRNDDYLINLLLHLHDAVGIVGRAEGELLQVVELAERRELRELRDAGEEHEAQIHRDVVVLLSTCREIAHSQKHQKREKEKKKKRKVRRVSLRGEPEKD